MAEIMKRLQQYLSFSNILTVYCEFGRIVCQVINS